MIGQLAYCKKQKIIFQEVVNLPKSIHLNSWSQNLGNDLYANLANNHGLNMQHRHEKMITTVH